MKSSNGLDININKQEWQCIIKIISLGLGLQSTTLYLMSNTGIYQRADYAIFADPGAENPKTYELLEWLLKWQSKNNGISIYVVKKNLYEDLLKQENSTGQRFVSIPVFAKKGLGILRRQCTYEYKVMVINKKIRELHKLKPRQWMKPTEVWIGITTDEASRMKDSNKFNIANKYPLIDLKMNRLDCKKWLEDKAYKHNDIEHNCCCDRCCRYGMVLVYAGGPSP